MPSHPNRSKRNPSPARNPKPAEIRKARLKAGLSRKDSAALVYYSERSQESWEEGVRRMHPSAFELWRLKVAERAEREANAEVVS